MGYRLHVAKTYKVEYSTSANFNWKKEEFTHLLDELNVPILGMGENGENDAFEVPKDEFIKGIGYLNQYSAKLHEISDNEVDYDAEYINDALRDLCYDEDFVKKYDCDTTKYAKDLVVLFKQYLSEGEKDSDYLHFCFF